MKEECVFSKVVFYILLFVILVIGVIQIVWLCKFCPRTFEESSPGFDYIGVIVGILALFVTFLLGWNIFSALKIENKQEDFVREYRTMLENLEANDRERTKIHNFEIGFLYKNIGVTLTTGLSNAGGVLDLKLTLCYLDSVLNSIDFLIKAESIDIANDLIEEFDVKSELGILEKTKYEGDITPRWNERRKYIYKETNGLKCDDLDRAIKRLIDKPNNY
ncbi:MAG: hypothetical protein MJZ19_11260 [Paludibacteraceae bacterium]|nr:hypothetical protein [Paludibacteraceae bacterium]